MGRFIAILLIIMLGVAFFAGLKQTRSVMLAVEFDYLEETKLYDLRLISTIGFEEDDIEKISEIDGVETAVGSINSDFITESNGEEFVYHAMMLTEGVNEPQLDSGRMPEAANECLADSQVFSEDDIGTTIVLSESNDEDTFDTFTYTEYTIVGICRSPLYLDISRGTTSLGSGSVTGFIIIPEDGFNSDYYTEVYLTSTEKYDPYTDEYNDMIDSFSELVEDETSVIINTRFDETVSDAEAEIADAESELEDSRAEAQQELDDAWAELTEYQAILNEYEAMGINVEDSWEDYYDSLAEYEDAVADFESEIADAEAEIADAKAELEELEEPTLYVFTRNINSGYVTFESDSLIVNNVAKLFPIFFFLIAALVCSTTMTRMIDDERSQIGIMSALGYSNRAILAKYVIYSGSAAVTGCVIGYFIGGALFPFVILRAYQILYNLEGFICVYNPIYFVISLVASLVCSVGTTVVTCRSALKCPPADLIRPKSPAAGKRILLERITPVWSKLKFMHKVTLRNIFRFKKRMVMMLMGIAGCTALVLTAFGIYDSVANIGNYQFDDIMTYDISVTFSDEITETDIENVSAELSDQIITQASSMSYSTDVSANDVYKTAYTLFPMMKPLEM